MAGASGARPPRILFVRNARGHTEISGPETYMLTIIPQLQADGAEVFLHCTVNPELGMPVFLADFERLGVPIELSSVGSATGFSDVGAVVRDATARGANILHSFDHRSDIVSVLAARRMGVANVASFAGWTNWTGRSLKERLYMRADRFALARSDAVLIDSRFVGERSRLRTDPHPVVVLPNGVDLQRFSNRAGAETKARFFGTADIVLCSVVGRVHPNTRQLDFVRAAADLVRDHPEARFLIVGAAPAGHEAYAEEVQGLIREAGLQERVRQVLAQPSEIPDIMAATDVLLAPCTTESCSFAIIEAMASGKPVVAARAGGNPELVVEGATGLLIAPESWTELRDGADRLIRDPALRRDLGEAALQRVRERYTVQAMGDATRRIYDAVLAFHGQPAKLKTHLLAEGFSLLR